MIRVDNLVMTFRGRGRAHQAVKNLSISIAQGQFYTLLGPSGCGKTTTLRCVAGLEKPIADASRWPTPSRGRRWRLDSTRQTQHRNGVPVVCDLAAYDRI